MAKYDVELDALVNEVGERLALLAKNETEFANLARRFAKLFLAEVEQN